MLEGLILRQYLHTVCLTEEVNRVHPRPYLHVRLSITASQLSLTSVFQAAFFRLVFLSIVISMFDLNGKLKQFLKVFDLD